MLTFIVSFLSCDSFHTAVATWVGNRSKPAKYPVGHRCILIRLSMQLIHCFTDHWLDERVVSWKDHWNCAWGTGRGSWNVVSHDPFPDWMHFTSTALACPVYTLHPECCRKDTALDHTMYIIWKKCVHVWADVVSVVQRVILGAAWDRNMRFSTRQPTIPNFRFECGCSLSFAHHLSDQPWSNTFDTVSSRFAVSFFFHHQPNKEEDCGTTTSWAAQRMSTTFSLSSRFALNIRKTNCLRIYDLTIYSIIRKKKSLL